MTPDALAGATTRHLTHHLPDRDAFEAAYEQLHMALEARDREYGEYRNDTFTHRSYDWEAECTCGFQAWSEQNRPAHAPDCYQESLRKNLAAAAPAGTNPRLSLPSDEIERITRATFEQHGLPYERYGFHCTCDYEQRYIAAATAAAYPEGCRSDCRTQQANFEHHQSGLKLTWYKYALRGAETNQALTLERWQAIINDCLTSLGVAPARWRGHEPSGMNNDPDKIDITWTTDDVLAQANEDGVELTQEEAREILADLRRRHDASIGINWQVISTHISDYKAQAPSA